MEACDCLVGDDNALVLQEAGDGGKRSPFSSQFSNAVLERHELTKQFRRAVELLDCLTERFLRGVVGVGVHELANRSPKRGEVMSKTCPAEVRRVFHPGRMPGSILSRVCRGRSRGASEGRPDPVPNPF